MMNMRNNIIIQLVALCALVSSCQGFHSAEYVEVNELLPVDKDFVEVDAMFSGTVSMDFYATSAVRAEVLTDVGDWAKMTSPSEFDGDGTVSIDFSANSSFRRMVAVRLVLVDKGLTDTLYFKQKGILPVLSCATPYAVVDGSREDKVSMTINTNINRPDLHVDITYLEGDGDWIEGMDFSGDIAWDKDDFTFITKANSGETFSRALVKIWFDDGWNEDVSVSLYLTRTSASGQIGSEINIADLGGHDGVFGPDDYIRGCVISDCNSLNMAENLNTAHNVVDRSISRRTVYISTPDGTRGVRLVLDKAEDNVFVPGMNLTLSLDGVILEKKENPACCTLKSIDIRNFLSVEAGTRLEPRVRTIDELTPEDIYTYITIKDVEFLNKKGAYTNVNDAFDCFDGWGSLLVDACGKAVFAPVNSECNWRRTGSGVPQGSGTVTGIIVSEDLKRFGNPGDWQIRVLDEGGFDMTDESRLADFATWTGAPGTSYGIDALIKGSHPSATLSTELDATDISTSTAGQAVRSVADFSGKTRTDNGVRANVALGYQVKLEGWYNFDENENISSVKGLVMNFSTSGKTGGMIAYISFLAWGNNGFYRVAPAHWILEYSVDGGTQYKVVAPSVKSVVSKDYVHLRPGPSEEAYHNGKNYFPSAYMAHGFCDVVYLLPDEIMDKENVRVRFAPSKDGVLFDFPAEASLFGQDIERNTMKPSLTYNGDIHFAEISFKTF